MISRPTWSIPKEDVVFPRLLYCDSRCTQTYCWRSQVCRRRSQVLQCLSSALPGLSPVLLVTLKAGINALLGSDTLLKLTHQSLHSTSSQTLLEAFSAQNSFCWYMPTKLNCGILTLTEWLNQANVASLVAAVQRLLAWKNSASQETLYQASNIVVDLASHLAVDLAFNFVLDLPSLRVTRCI